MIYGIVRELYTAARMQDEGSAALLKEATQLLHLVIYRNKNQHASSKWWKWLSMLKRNIAYLLVETNNRRTNQSRLRAREQHVRGHILPRCYW